MTGDAKKNVENKGAAAEQVALNTWCLPKENQNLRDRLAQQMDTEEWLSTVDRCGGGDSDRAAVAARLTELLQPVPLWTPHALVALLEREANSLAETGRTPGRAPTRGRAERTQEAEAEPTGAAEVGAEAEAAAAGEEPDLSDGTEEEAEADVCACSGNCGWRLCKRNQNIRQQGRPVSICLEPPSPGAKFCTRCVCEVVACSHPRLRRCERRWCNLHGSTAKPPPWQHREEWSPELNLVSRLAPVLQHLSTDDISCVTELGRQLGGEPGTPVQPLEFFFLFLGHAIKWPPVVRRLADMLHKQGLAALLAQTPGGAEDFGKLAAGVVRLLRELVEFAVKGNPAWSDMFEGGRVGYVGLASGLGPLATDLGLLERRGEGRRVKLGEHRYFPVPGDTAAVARVERMIRAAFAVEREVLTWPGAAGDVPDFLRGCRDLVQEIRRAGGLLGGQGDKPGYLVLSFVRAALVAQIAAYMPSAMDQFTMTQAVGVVSVSAVSALSRRSPRYPAAVVVHFVVFHGISLFSGLFRVISLLSALFRHASCDE
jgi:hypothetical protein